MGGVDRVRTRRSARAAALALALAAPLALTACGQRSEPTGATVPLYPVTVQQASGAPLVVHRHPEHVVAVTPQAAGLLSALLGHEVQQGQPSSDTDLVVATPENLRPLSSPSYVAPDSSIDDVERALTSLGLLIDRPLEARRVVHDLESKRQQVRERLRGVPPVSVFLDTGLYTTVSANTLIGDLIAEAGGRNIVGAKPQAGPFPLRRLRQADPDYYLATSDAGTTLSQLRHDPQTRHLRAVKAGHFAVLSSNDLLPGAQLGGELVLLAHTLHPNAFR